jgi:hypothetical protein
MRKQKYFYSFAVIFFNLFLVSQTWASSLEERVISSGPNTGKKLIDVIRAYTVKGRVIGKKGKRERDEHIPEKAIQASFDFFDKYEDTTRRFDTKMWLDPSGKTDPFMSDRVSEYTSPTIPNKRYMIIFDMNLHSSVRRFHIINLETGVISSLNAAHGADTDCGGNRFGYACKFADNKTIDPDLEDKIKVKGAEASPLGFFATGPEYKPSGPRNHKHGVFINGLEKNSGSFEGNDLPDSLIIHDADYVIPDQTAGRSWGCVALSVRDMEQWKDKIKDGALVYFYHDQIERMNRVPAVSGLIRAGN